MYFAGFDIGTRFIKVCIVKEGRIAAFRVREISDDIRKIIDSAYSEAKKEAGASFFSIKNSVSTGYGSEFVSKGKTTINTASCIAKAAYTADPSVSSVIDVGALFIHIAQIGKNGRVTDSMENEKCAAGSGKFLETISRAVEVPFKDLSEIASGSTQVYTITNSCSVFAESEVISEVNRGRRREDILSGLIVSVASKVATMVEKSKAQEPFALTGGVSRIPFFTTVLTGHLKKKIVFLPIDNQIAAAYGAALIAEERYKR